MKCEKCGQKMEKAHISASTGGKICVANPESKNILGGMKTSDINVYVCPECGYIELYAAKPEVFKVKSDD